MTAAALIATASVLGLLAFFEPCTIATHTLFSARTHARSRPACCRELFVLWLTRSLLVTGLLLIAVLLTPPPVWGGVWPSVILAVMASVYIVSRFVYLPVPHLEFYRLVPGGPQLPAAVRLGLTLPACTLPLFLIVLGMAITLDSEALAIFGGLLFATLFTLPTAIAAAVGLSAAGRRFLKTSASATSYVTAGLLYAAALYLLL
jgi:cytochrome c-type biogenesis protein